MNGSSAGVIIDVLMNSRGRLLLSLILPLVASPAAPQEASRYVGAVRFSVDTRQGFPGGFLIARLQSRIALGTAYAILDGRRAPFYSSPRGLRALVPVPLSSVAGPTTIGFELASRRGRQRIPLDLALAARTYPPRSVTIPEAKRGLLVQANVTRDGRELLTLVRTETSKPAPGPLKPPVTVAPGVGFGGVQTWLGGPSVEPLFDATFGDEHRGLDYEVPTGTVVMAPAGGNRAVRRPLDPRGPGRGDRPRPGCRQHARPPAADRRPGGRRRRWPARSWGSPATRASRSPPGSVARLHPRHRRGPEAPRPEPRLRIGNRSGPRGAAGECAPLHLD